MTGAERGFLLLTSKLGNPDRKPLTVAQLRELTARVQHLNRRDFSRAADEYRALDVYDLVAIGYGPKLAAHIVDLTNEDVLLSWYITRAQKAKCIPVTRATECYPPVLRNRLGLDSPGVLWAKGDLRLLDTPAIALVGSRELHPANREFAEAVGREAARQGITLVSGNARGADKTAQNACLAAGGKVISVVADGLETHKLRDNLLYLSEDSFDEAFSPQRALSRNRVIHCLGVKTFVAQCNLGVGGTWDGTVKNLQKGWSPVFCFDDGSPAVEELKQLGATAVKPEQLSDLPALQANVLSFL